MDSNRKCKISKHRSREQTYIITSSIKRDCHTFVNKLGLHYSIGYKFSNAESTPLKGIKLFKLERQPFLKTLISEFIHGELYIHI